MNPRKKSCKSGIRSIPLIGAAALVQSCVAQAPDPKLVAAVSPGNPSEMSVSGALLNECFKSNSGLLSKLQQNSVAYFSSAATYKFAERMKRSPGDIGRYAERIRGYGFQYEHTSIFGQNKFERYCYYGRNDKELIYLTNLTADSVGSVRSEEFAGAIVEAYEKLSGKKMSSPQKIIAIMSIPTQ